jgi:Gamma-glutamyl cyclotransferase, AIG2-like
MAKKTIPIYTRTSGSKTADDWMCFRERLKEDFQNEDLWLEAYKVFFLERIESRFLAPVRLIKDNTDPERIGAGFAIVAILCILMEHLQAFYEGVIYTTGGDQRLCEYRSSKDLFRQFLTTHEPFKSAFDKKDAERFYDDVRCGLLHEAATKGDAKIRKQRVSLTSTIFENNQEGFIVYRNSLLTSLETYLDTYKTNALHDELLRSNLFRKLDELNGVHREFYFAYGSNLLSQQLISERNIFVHLWRVGRLDGYKITFNKKSTITNNTYANIEATEGSSAVWGVVFEMDDADLDRLSRYENGYDRKNASCAEFGLALFKK